MEARKQPDDKYVKRVYHRIIVLAEIAHISYFAIFAALGLEVLAVYNVASVIFYVLMQLAVRSGYYRFAVFSIHIEVCTFASVCTLIAGWDIGVALYLIAMTSLTYFCPFRHKSTPYLFALLEICVFIALKSYTSVVTPGYLAVSEGVGLWLYLYSICACSTIMLYAAFSSKLSAAVSFQEIQDENRSLTFLANYDQLTGLLSRHALLSRMESLQGETVVVALSDIDDFKEVNDTWGHACGDLILSESAELIKRLLGGEVDVCRWGGEEFLYVFRDLSLEEVFSRIQDLCDAIARHIFRFGQQELTITMTFGITPGVKGVTPKELIALADQRMYEGKTSGKNQVVCLECCIGQGRQQGGDTRDGD